MATHTDGKEPTYLSLFVMPDSLFLTHIFLSMLQSPVYDSLRPSLSVHLKSWLLILHFHFIWPCFTFLTSKKTCKICLRCHSYNKDLRILKERENMFRQEIDSLRAENAALKQEKEALYDEFAPSKKRLRKNGQN